MAENTGQERTEEPTEKRLEDSRRKGQIARSRELNTFVVMVSGATLLMFAGQRMMADSISLFRGQFSLTRDEIFDSSIVVAQLSQSILSGFSSIVPLLVVTVVSAFVGSISCGGWIFSSQAFAPKFERFDPIKGIGRLFSVRSLVELVKALLKVTLVLGVMTILFRVFFDEFLELNREPLGPAVSHAASLIGVSFIILCCSLVVIAAIDVPFQRWNHKKQLKMTRQEVKDEAKERDGNPEVKGRIRRLQMEMAQQRMMEKVPTADVIVTNPTHYAVAIRYDPDKAQAPRVVAKGKDLIAAKIRSLANGARIPLVTAPPLARALYSSVKLDAEIPKELYLAVAQVWLISIN